MSGDEIKMKGVVAPIGGTLLVAIAAVAVILIGLILYAALKFMSFTGDGPNTVNIEFLAESNKAYIFATLLTHLKAGDKNFLEHSNSIVATSVQGAASESLAAYLDDFAKLYTKEDQKLVRVSIIKDKNVTVEYSNQKQKCGNNLEGYCVVSGVFVNDFFVKFGTVATCGIGRKIIYPGTNKCTIGICCAEDNEGGVYDPKFDRCGPSGSTKEGICDYEIYGKCATGRIKYPSEEKDCSDGMVCCIAETEIDTLKSRGILSTAQIPLLYKGNFGIAEVDIW